MVTLVGKKFPGGLRESRVSKIVLNFLTPHPLTIQGRYILFLHVACNIMYKYISSTKLWKILLIEKRETIV